MVLVLATGVLAFSCTEGLKGSGKALANFRLIDAPGDFDEAWIEIRGVRIVQENNDADPIFIPYDQPNQQVDVSKLVGGGVLLIGRSEIPVGSISKISLVLGEDHYLIKDGNRRSLALNSGKGDIDVAVDFPMKESLSYDVYLDLDLEKSILGTTDSTQFRLSPRVRAFMRNETAELAGRLRPAGARPVLLAIQGSDTLTTMTNTQGEYLLMGLQSGLCTLLIQPRKPYLDTAFLVETAIGKVTSLEDIDLKLATGESGAGPL